SDGMILPLFKLREGIAKNLCRGASGCRVCVEFGVPAHGLLSPKQVVFLVRQVFQALKKYLCQAGPILRCELQHRCFDLTNAHMDRFYPQSCDSCQPRGLRPSMIRSDRNLKRRVCPAHLGHVPGCLMPSITRFALPARTQTDSLRYPRP